MLGQIERGESSPTISVVWKIASGLKLSFTSLVDSHQAEINKVTKSSITPLIEDGSRYRLYPFFPFEEGRSFEIYQIEIDKGGSISADPHSDGVEEFIMVFQGELTIDVNDQKYKISAGDSIRFRADKKHGYFNQGETMVRLNMVINYPPR